MTRFGEKLVVTLVSGEVVRYSGASVVVADGVLCINQYVGTGSEAFVRYPLLHVLKWTWEYQ